MGKIIRWFQYGPDVLTVAEFAKMAGISQSTIRRIIARREVISFCEEGFPTLITSASARRWMDGLPPIRGEFKVVIQI